VATQSKWLQAGINVEDKSERVNYYFTKFKKELLEITYACGYEHPCQFKMDDVDINLGDKNMTKTLAETFFYNKKEVPFESTEVLYKSEYLGAAYRKKEESQTPGETTQTKEVETEQTSATDPEESTESKQRKSEKRTPEKKVEESTDVKTGEESKKPSEHSADKKKKQK
jgi:hypothetical protein